MHSTHLCLDSAAPDLERRFNELIETWRAPLTRPVSANEPNGAERDRLLPTSRLRSGGPQPASGTTAPIERSSIAQRMTVRFACRPPTLRYDRARVLSSLERVAALRVSLAVSNSAANDGRDAFALGLHRERLKNRARGPLSTHVIRV